MEEVEGRKNRDDLKYQVHKRYRFDKQIRIDAVFLYDEGGVTSNLTIFYKNGKVKEVLKNVMEGFIDEYN